MEFLEITLVVVKQFLYSVIHHPFYSAVGCFFLFCFLLSFYCRLTVGMCNVDQDMTGKTVLITGASAGIGKATAMDLARRKARVLLACRNIKKTNKVAEEIKLATGNENVFVKHLDLCSFTSVRACAKSVLETEEKLHVLINNAGIIDDDHFKKTEDGCDLIMQSNHFGHFLLTLLLLDLLKHSSPSRIINVSSEAHRYAKLDLEDLNNDKKQIFFYGKSKLANIYFTRELADRLEGTGVTVNSLHPGAVKTDILNNKKGFLFLVLRLFLFLILKTPEEGAQTTIRLAVDPCLEKTTGKYFSDCKETPASKEAEDRSKAKRLFLLSEQVVGQHLHSYTSRIT